MFDDSFAHLKGEIQPGMRRETLFEMLDDAQRMKIVVKTATVPAHQRIQAAFPGVAERGMANVMHKSEGFREIGIQAERFCHRACDLRDLERMRQPVAEMIRITRSEDLRFGFEAAKSARVNDAIAVARVFLAIRMRSLGVTAATRLGFLHGPGNERGVAFDDCSSN